MGSKASTPHTPDSEDSSTTSQAYSRAERVSDHEQSARQARQERSFMERAESSLHGLLYSNGPGVDIRRSNGDQHPSYGSSPVRPGSGSIPSAGPNRSYSMGGGAGPESVGSSSGSTGLSHFLSNFNLWRASVPGSGGGDRQRAQSLSHVPPDPHSSSSTSSSSSAAAAQAADSSSSRSRSHYSEQSDDLSSLVVNPRAALARLLSSSGRDGRNGAGTTRDNNGGTTFSVRDLTFAAAQEFLAEATMNGAGRVYVTHSLPSHMWAVNGIKCPVCSKFVMPDDIECHLVMCLTKPRLNYNEDILTEDNKGECVICLEDLLKGHVIARLPCLCVYHKSCIDQWFDVNRSCPEHPSD